MRWKLVSKKVLLSSIPFNVETLDFVDKQTGIALSHPFHRLTCPDWVNILAITHDGHAILVRQSRAGSLSDTLEIPGGMIDEGEDPLIAAKRELEEETGYRCDELLPIGSINPNPAIMANTVHMFLAQNCALPLKREHFPDESENLEIILAPLAQLSKMVYQQEINSALSALTIMMAQGKLDGN